MPGGAYFKPAVSRPVIYFGKLSSSKAVMATLSLKGTVAPLLVTLCDWLNAGHLKLLPSAAFSGTALSAHWHLFQLNESISLVPEEHFNSNQIQDSDLECKLKIFRQLSAISDTVDTTRPFDPPLPATTLHFALGTPVICQRQEPHWLGIPITVFPMPSFSPASGFSKAYFERESRFWGASLTCETEQQTGDFTQLEALNSYPFTWLGSTILGVNSKLHFL